MYERRRQTALRRNQESMNQRQKSVEISPIKPQTPVNRSSVKSFAKTPIPRASLPSRSQLLEPLVGFLYENVI